jgi:hypothetical protein
MWGTRLQVSASFVTVACRGEDSLLFFVWVGASQNNVNKHPIKENKMQVWGCYVPRQRRQMMEIPSVFIHVLYIDENI